MAGNATQSVTININASVHSPYIIYRSTTHTKKKKKRLPRDYEYHPTLNVEYDYQYHCSSTARSVRTVLNSNINNNLGKILLLSGAFKEYCCCTEFQYYVLHGKLVRFENENGFVPYSCSVIVSFPFSRASILAVGIPAAFLAAFLAALAASLAAFLSCA